MTFPTDRRRRRVAVSLEKMTITAAENHACLAAVNFLTGNHPCDPAQLEHWGGAINDRQLRLMKDLGKTNWIERKHFQCFHCQCRYIQVIALVAGLAVFCMVVAYLCAAVHPLAASSIFAEL